MTLDAPWLVVAALAAVVFAQTALMAYVYALLVRRIDDAIAVFRDVKTAAKQDPVSLVTATLNSVARVYSKKDD